MPNAEKTARLQELRNLVEHTLVPDYNEAYQNKKFDEAVKIDEKMQEAINEYTGIVRDLCFATCAESPDPMLTAVTLLSYLTIGVKDTKEGEDKIPVRQFIEAKPRQIDLLKLNSYCKKKIGKGIGHADGWLYAIEKFNLLMTCQKAIDLGIDPTTINDSYAMSEIARGYDLGKNPASKTNLLKTMRAIVTAMLGEEYANKVVSHDVNFLLSVYSRKSRKALTVTVANHKYLRGYLAEICHRAVTGKSYAIDYRQIKK